MFAFQNLSRLFTVQLSKFCLLLEASCCRCSSQRQLIHCITVELVCQQLFYFIFETIVCFDCFRYCLAVSLIILSYSDIFVNTFFTFFYFFDLTDFFHGKTPVTLLFRGLPRSLVMKMLIYIKEIASKELSGCTAFILYNLV